MPQPLDEGVKAGRSMGGTNPALLFGRYVVTVELGKPNWFAPATRVARNSADTCRRH